MNTSTLVLGASENTERYSNKAIHKLRANKIEVFAIGAKKGIVLGVDIEVEKKLFKNVDTVIESSYNDPDENKISVGNNINMESVSNKILVA